MSADSPPSLRNTTTVSNRPEVLRCREASRGIEQVWQGDGLVMFGGHFRFVLQDGSSPATPFWNIFIMAADNPQKVVKGSAIFDMATVPPNYWPTVTD